MAYVITQNCCKDASCVPVCPVDCIRPVGAPGELTGEEMLYIDPETCIDCGACLEECPVEAIYYAADLTTELLPFEDINAKYFEQNPLEPRGLAATVDHAGIAPGALRVAVVGAGPAACYAAAALVRTDGVEVDVYDRLPTPFGLVRAGVAPDHQHTKAIVDVFGRVLSNPRVQCHFNVEIGRELSHAELLDHHHAVIYAHGASQSRDLGIPGEQLDGNHAAAEFVGWYNGHPDHASRQFDLSGERAVVIGNGNVALDVARVLLLGTAELSDTDIAEHALEALAHSAIREVVILGRRGPRDAAFSVGEFMALEHLAGIDVIIESTDLQPRPGDHVETVLKLEVARRFAARPTNPDHKRIVFRFCTTPTELVGSTAVEGLRVLATGAGTEVGTTECLDTRLVLRSIGYRGSPTEGLPFDDARGVVPNDGGRVLNTPGVYVTGWIKRGPRGVIGTNRVCAEETVAHLWQDYDSGSLTRDIRDRGDVDELIKHRGGEAIGWKGWKAIDAAERRNGTPRRRPRVKFVAISAMLDATKA